MVYSGVGIGIVASVPNGSRVAGERGLAGAFHIDQNGSVLLLFFAGATAAFFCSSILDIRASILSGCAA